MNSNAEHISIHDQRQFQVGMQEKLADTERALGRYQQPFPLQVSGPWRP